MFSAVRHSSIKQTLGHHYLQHYEKVFNQGEVNQGVSSPFAPKACLTTSPPPPTFPFISSVFKNPKVTSASKSATKVLKWVS